MRTDQRLGLTPHWSFIEPLEKQTERDGRSLDCSGHLPSLAGKSGGLRFRVGLPCARSCRGLAARGVERFSRFILDFDRTSRLSSDVLALISTPRVPPMSPHRPGLILSVREARTAATSDSSWYKNHGV